MLYCVDSVDTNSCRSDVRLSRSQPIAAPPGYLGDAANSRNPRYGRTWIAMFSVTVPWQRLEAEVLGVHVDICRLFLTLRRASLSCTWSTWEFREKPVSAAGHARSLIGLWALP